MNDVHSNFRRLFLFAGYSPDSVVDDALIHHVSSISKYGDVIAFMDCDCDDNDIAKLKPYCKYVGATRHGEYDFGSYKRAYQYAYENKMLDKYDAIFLVNDSVFGPLFDMFKIIKKIDSMSSDAVGLVVSTHKTHSYMESWFIRLNKSIFLSDWFHEFITGVTVQPTKNRVTIKYEHGLSDLTYEHNLSWDGVFIRHGRFTYNNPKKLYKIGCPFIKKACFKRHYGALGGEVRYVLRHCEPKIMGKVMNSANRIYGTDYMNWLLTRNPIKILWRKIRYAAKKIKSGKI